MQSGHRKMLSRSTIVRFEDKLKCPKCQVAMKKIGVKYEKSKAREVHKCPSCGKTKYKEEKDEGSKNN
tara:strand:- start:340 stop:543 length:204 start_codon:yes stop_codon:yes gene_type:complete